MATLSGRDTAGTSQFNVNPESEDTKKAPYPRELLLPALSAVILDLFQPGMQFFSVSVVPPSISLAAVH